MKVIAMFRSDNNALMSIYKDVESIKKEWTGIELDVTNLEYGHFEGVTSTGNEVRFELHDVLGS